MLGQIAPGTRLGRWSIERKLGQGAMGAVYAARDERGAPAALKLLLGVDEAWVMRFEREARAACSVKHGNVAATYPLERDGRFFILPMELVRGGNLRELVKKGGPLPWRDAARLGLGIARGLSAIHAAGLVHRDLKPANVLLDPAGEPRITDFGLVRRPGSTSVALTGTGEILGTFEYMAPEMGERADVDGRADLYSLGATLYELLSGRPPFEGSGYTVLAKHFKDKPASLSAKGVPPELDALVLTLLAKAPGDRPQSAVEVVRSLERFVATPRSEEPPARRVSPLALSLGLLVVLAGAAALLAPPGSFSGAPAPPPPPSEPPPPTDPFLARYAAAIGSTALASLDMVRAHDEMAHAGEVRAVAFCRDPKRVVRLVSGGADDAVRVWDVEKGLPARTALSLPSGVRTLGVSDDGARIVVGTTAGLARAYDVWTGRKLGERSHGPGPVVAALSPDGKRAASVPLHRSERVRVWEVTDDRKTEALDPPLLAWFLRFSPAGSELIAGLAEDQGRSGSVARFDLTHEGYLPAEPRGSGPPLEGTIRLDGTVVTVSRFGELVVEPPGTMKPTVIRVHPGAAQVCGLAPFPRDRRVATGGHDGYVEIWDLGAAPPRQTRRFRAHASAVNAVAVHPEGNLIATGSADGTVRIFDAEGVERTPGTMAAGHRGRIRSISLSRDLVLTAGEDGTVKEWDPESGKLRASHSSVHTSGVVGATVLIDPVDGDRLVLSLGRFDGLRLWRLRDDRELAKAPSGCGVLGAQHLALEDDGRRAIVSNDWDADAHLFEIEASGSEKLLDRGPLRSPAVKSSWFATHATAFAPGSGSFVAAGAGRGNVNGAPVGNLFLGSEGAPLDLRALPGEREACLDSVAYLGKKGERVIAASRNGSVALWDLARSEPVWTIPCGASDDIGVAALGTEKVLVISSARLIFVDAGSGRCIESIDLAGADDRLTCVAYDEARRWLWVGTAKGALLRLSVRLP